MNKKTIAKIRGPCKLYINTTLKFLHFGSAVCFSKMRLDTCFSTQYWERLNSGTMGLFTKERVTFQKLFWITIQTLSWFESLILPFVNAKLFQIRLLKRRKKRRFGLWSALKAWFWGLVNAKLFRNVIRACAPEVSAEERKVDLLVIRVQLCHKILPRSAQLDPLHDWDGGCNACERT